MMFKSSRKDAQSLPGMDIILGEHFSDGHHDDLRVRIALISRRATK
jgi:hypothetical protein